MRDGAFDITRAQETVQGIRFTYCQVIQRLDGFSYQLGEVSLFKQLEKKTFSSPA